MSSQTTTPADQPSLRADIDSPKFRALLITADHNIRSEDKWAKVIAHINAHTTRAVEAAVAAAPNHSGELEQLRAQNMLLVGLYDAVAKLVKAKGSYHTEQNYGQLVAAYDLIRTTATTASDKAQHKEKA